MGVEYLTGNLYQLLLGRFQAYLWRDDNGVTLVDTGAADTGGEIAAVLDEIGLAPSAINRVVLTHFHDDHAGAAAELRDWGNIEIVAHKADAPIIRGEVPAQPPNITDGELEIHAQVTAELPPAPPVAVDREVIDESVLDFGGGAHVLAAPGHTDGSIALHLPEHGVLLTGEHRSAGRQPARLSRPQQQLCIWPRHLTASASFHVSHVGRRQTPRNCVRVPTVECYLWRDPSPSARIVRAYRARLAANAALGLSESRGGQPEYHRGTGTNSLDNHG